MNQITFHLPTDPHDALAILCEMRDALDERAVKIRKFDTPAWDAKADQLETAAREVHAAVLAIMSKMARNVIRPS